MGLAAAAGIAATIALGIFFAWGRPEEEVAERPERYVLARQQLRDRAVIEAEEWIHATDSRVDGGAEVTLRAPEVVLGEGFTVQEGGSLSVETTF